MKSEDDRDEEVADIIQKSVSEQENAMSILRQVNDRLDRLSAELRKQGAFPIAGQLDREKQEAEAAKNVIPSGG